MTSIDRLTEIIASAEWDHDGISEVMRDAVGPSNRHAAIARAVLTEWLPTPTDVLSLLVQHSPRFWASVGVTTSPNECWPFLGWRNKEGYGRIKTPAGGLAHRYSWALMNGRIPEPDEVVRHVCDNPPCVNPRHLLIGTQADNMRDLAERGAQAVRCKNGHIRTPENTKLAKNGARSCRICLSAKWRRDKEERREREARRREAKGESA